MAPLVTHRQRIMPRKPANPPAIAEDPIRIDRPLIEAAAAEFTAHEDNEADCARAGVPAELVVFDPKGGVHARYRAYMGRQLAGRKRLVRKQAAKHYRVEESDEAMFESIAMVEFLRECLAANIKDTNTLNLTSVNDKGTVGKGEDAILLDYIMQFTRLSKELRSAMLLTRGSRQNHAVAQEQRDVMSFFADARAKLLERGKQQAITVDVKASTP